MLYNRVTTHRFPYNLLFPSQSFFLSAVIRIKCLVTKEQQLLVWWVCLPLHTLLLNI